MELVSSGIKELDKLLGGGVPRGTQILLEVETGTIPLLFVEKWLHEGLRQQDVCFFYSYDYSVDEILQKYKEFGIVPEEFLKKGKIVDFWTKGGEYVRDFSKHIITIGEPNNANRIMDVIVMTFGFEKTYKLAKEITQVAKTENAITLDVIGIGMHNSMELKTFEFLYDAVVRLETKEINGELTRYVRVFKSPILDYVTKKIPYSFKKNDLVF
jgi:circadian clock protein KaiC